jgi:hypothetical protein
MKQKGVLSKYARPVLSHFPTVDGKEQNALQGASSINSLSMKGTECGKKEGPPAIRALSATRSYHHPPPPSEFSPFSSLGLGHGSRTILIKGAALTNCAFLVSKLRP